jgi:2-hydroxy-3-oxopropionate reductase
VPEDRHLYIVDKLAPIRDPRWVSSLSTVPSCSNEKAATGSDTQPRAVRTGLIGLGTMGRPMAKNLLRAGYPLSVHSRSPGPVDELVAAGATKLVSPEAVANASDVVITMLPDTPDVELVLAGPDGILSAAAESLLIIDMSTINPSATRRMASVVQQRGWRYIDAPVSGGERGATDAALSIMVGGGAEDLEEALPILSCLGSTIVHVGDVGAGQVAKAANQLVVAVTIEAVAESLWLAEAAGVDPSAVRSAMLGGLGASRVLEMYGQRMIDKNYNPGFRLALQLKDALIVANMTAEFGLDTVAHEATCVRLVSLVEAGLGNLDHSALHKRLTPTDAIAR